jgi:hypothetical protein
MKVYNKVELQIEGFEKCKFLVDSDCPLGHLYDYSCALHAFIVGKIKEADEAKKPEENPSPE